MQQIIWTLTELAEWAKTSISEFGPMALISVAPASKHEELEISNVNGRIVSIIIWIPPGTMNLAWVTVFHVHNGEDKLLLTPRGGDNVCHTALAADDIEAGDSIKVIVRNNDVEWNHTIGIRVEVDTVEVCD